MTDKRSRGKKNTNAKRHATESMGLESKPFPGMSEKVP